MKSRLVWVFSVLLLPLLHLRKQRSQVLNKEKKKAFQGMGDKTGNEHQVKTLSHLD